MSDTIRIYDSGVFCARIFNTSTGALLTKEEVELITYTANRLTTKSLMSGTVTRTPVEGHSNIMVDKSQVFLEEAIFCSAFSFNTILPFLSRIHGLVGPFAFCCATRIGNFWSIDETGYSCIHRTCDNLITTNGSVNARSNHLRNKGSRTLRPNTRTNQLFTEAGKYEVLYNIRLVEGNPVVLAFEVTVS